MRNSPLMAPRILLSNYNHALVLFSQAVPPKTAAVQDTASLGLETGTSFDKPPRPGSGTHRATLCILQGLKNLPGGLRGRARKGRSRVPEESPKPSGEKPRWKGFKAAFESHASEKKRLFLRKIYKRVAKRTVKPHTKSPQISYKARGCRHGRNGPIRGSCAQSGEKAISRR